MKPVSKSEIIKMREEYENTLRKISTADLKKRFPERPWIEEVSSAWISRKELEDLLNDNNANGLRIYYGCHHESTSKDPHEDYLGLHNVILVATKDSVNPKQPSIKNSKDQLQEGGIKISVSTEDGQGNYSGSGGDAVPLCPPNCP
jgi:hypothetical protein